MINFHKHEGFYIPETNEKKSFSALQITHLGAKNKVQLQCIITIGETDYNTTALQIPDNPIVLKQILEELSKNLQKK